jgi:alpha-amylase
MSILRLRYLKPLHTFDIQLSIMKKTVLIIALATALISCKEKPASPTTSEEKAEKEYAYFDWDAANVYFLLTDRFKNGDTSNDTIVERIKPTGVMRGFQGGDFAGITEKIDNGYFTDLGVNAIWLTPIWEQIHDGVDEGTGYSYAFHGYWAKDWTAVEPSYGTLSEFKMLVDKAHKKNIRVLLDVVLNHTGPVTELDPQWPDEWVRTGPGCTYRDQATAMTCTLTNNLPDIRTESTQEVELPQILIDKWTEEGRLDQEVAELDTFFEDSGLARIPVNYVIKWITDYARETGVDGFRIDTVKHVEEDVWSTLIDQAKIAYEDWKEANPLKMIHDDEFYILGELYGYEVSNGRSYNFGTTQVDYFDHGYDAMISFGFKRDASEDYSTLFKRYSTYRDSLIAQNPENPAAFMNYISSHDDGQPFDPVRDKSMESGTKLLLTTGMSQIYYGDESARSLIVENAVGDATLRSPMNWSSTDNNVLEHWQKLGSFRNDHPAVGAGEHVQLVNLDQGTIAARFYDKNSYKDEVIIGAGLEDGVVEINVEKVFPDTSRLFNAYSKEKLAVVNGNVQTMAINGVVLIERMP